MKNEKHQNEKSMKNTHIQFSTLPLFFFGELYIASDSFLTSSVDCNNHSDIQKISIPALVHFYMSLDCLSKDPKLWKISGSQKLKNNTCAC